MRAEALIPMILLMTACTATEPPAHFLGQTEWKRVSLVAEASEPLLAIHVAQGEQVEAGQLLAQLDPARAAARLTQASAEQARASAALEEALNGTRSETLASARAELASLRATQEETRREQVRVGDLVSRGLAAASERDRVEAAAARAAAAVAAAQARLEELLHGTRTEQVAQAEAALTVAEAVRVQVELDVQRLTLRAPRAGRVDALPFIVGDHPPLGATLVTLLVGDAPYARIYVPAAQRATLAPGRPFSTTIAGVDGALQGQLREIASEPAFTPYFALTGEDASQLVYRAEITLALPPGMTLAAGLPLQATLRDAQ
jgi:HlyD family secretion protein